MTVNRFIFQSSVNLIRRIIFFVLSLFICVLISSFLPGWNYFNDNEIATEKYFGAYVPIIILLTFYLFLYVIIYKSLFNKFSKKLIVNRIGDGEFVLNIQNGGEFNFKTNDCIFNKNDKTFTIKNHSKIILEKHQDGLSVKSFRDYIEKSSLQKENNKVISFSGTILSVRFLYFALAICFIIYIAYSILIYKIFIPHIEAFQLLFRAKSPLLMIVIGLPFLAVFFVVMYYVFQQFILKKELITADWSQSKTLILKSSKNFKFNKAEIKNSYFFINRITNLSKWLVIEQSNGLRYMILCKSEDNTAYQKFIDSYIEKFDIDIEKSTTTVGSSSSPIMKKKYTHE